VNRPNPIKHECTSSIDHGKFDRRHAPATFAHNIVDLGAKAPEDQGLMEYTSYWFNGIAHAIAGLKVNLKVEIEIIKP
jgi:hypothetical protein